MARFKTIRDLIPENEAAEMWEAGYQMRRLATEIQDWLGSAVADEVHMQDPFRIMHSGCSWKENTFHISMCSCFLPAFLLVQGGNPVVCSCIVLLLI